MKNVYVNNYKGFVEALIPIADVNFLVGENSTGKTAILNLLEVLHNPSFWLDADFNDGNVNLGYFDEIVNQHSSDKSHFIIAVECNDKKTKNKSIFFWMKFTKKKQLPNLDELMFTLGDKTVFVKIYQKRVEYKFKEYAGESFNLWISNTEFVSQVNRVNMGIWLKRKSIVFIRNMVSQDMENVGGLSSDISFFAPLFNYYWFAPIRAKAKRAYESFRLSFSPEGEHTPNLLRDLLKGGKEKNKKLINDLLCFGRESALFEDIKIDEYGKENGAPFAINVLYNNLPIKITNVGYGVSQVIPLVVEILTVKHATFSIQQPEVHLHPKAQASFGDLIYDSVVENKNKFLIETHSDFTINRFRYKTYKLQEKKNKLFSQVLFFERSIEGTKITIIPISEKGEYIGDIPDSFSEFFIDEELKMLEF